MPDRRPNRDPSWTLTCFIRDSSPTDLPHRRLTCLIDNPSDTDMHNINKQKVYKMCLNSDWTPQACWSLMSLHRHFRLQWGMLVSDGACLSPMGLRSGMSVSDSGMSVSDGACRSPVKHFEVSNGSPISHVGL